jgi:hypothetical protein
MESADKYSVIITNKMYIKHYWVSYPEMDRFLIESNEVPKTHPNIKGLNVKFWLTDDNGVDYCLSVCDDDALLPGGNGVTQLTEEEWNDIVIDYNSKQPQNTNTILPNGVNLSTLTEEEILSTNN